MAVPLSTQERRDQDISYVPAHGALAGRPDARSAPRRPLRQPRRPPSPVTKVGTKTMEIQDGNGTVASGTICLTVGPDQDCLGSHVPGITGPLHCRITAKKKALRGALYNQTTGISTEAR